MIEATPSITIATVTAKSTEDLIKWFDLLEANGRCLKIIELVTDDYLIRVTEGDSSDNGFYDPDRNIKSSLQEEEVVVMMRKNKGIFDYEGSFFIAIKKAKNLGCIHPSSSFVTEGTNHIWFSSESDTNYRTGVDTTYSIHFNNVTPRMALKIAKELGAKVEMWK